MTAIRKARADDLAAMIAVDDFAQSHPERADEIANWLEAGTAFVAERDGAIVGYAVLTHGRLIDHLVAHVGTEIWTSTNRSNLPMRELLARSGFTESGFIEGLDPGDPELVFRR